jgi:hypothetical protein
MPFMTIRKVRAHRDFVATVGALAALVVGGGFAGNLSTYAAADTMRTDGTRVQDRCAGGTEVSGFVCRNTWFAYTKR